MKNLLIVSILLCIVLAGCENKSNQTPASQSQTTAPDAVVEAAPSEKQKADSEARRFICNEMDVSFVLLEDWTAGYFPNEETKRPMISVSDGEREVVGIVWFKDVPWSGTADSFIDVWVLKDNTTDRELKLTEKVPAELRPLTKNGRTQVKTGLGQTTLLYTETLGEEGVGRRYGAYIMHKGSILWIGTFDWKTLVSVLQSIKEVQK